MIIRLSKLPFNANSGKINIVKLNCNYNKFQSYKLS